MTEPPRPAPLSADELAAVAARHDAACHPCDSPACVLCPPEQRGPCDLGRMLATIAALRADNAAMVAGFGRMLAQPWEEVPDD